MNGIGAALIVIFCTPMGWIGMLIFGAMVSAILGH